jgi:RNA polymerase sigma factor (sigma-70 family)
MSMQETSNSRIHRLIRNFLQDETSALLFERALSDPTPYNQERVDYRFRAFCREIQFIAYLSTLIHYHAITYDKRIRAQNAHCPLRLDAPLDDEGSSAILDRVAASEEIDFHSDALITLEEISEHRAFYHALRLLTDKEKQILEQVYIQNFSDTEIARKLGVSQQTVSKTRKKALAKLRMNMKEGRDFCQSTQNTQA